ncbi:pentatricopeptide repeat-containing protein At4g38010-like [Carya illinoinensis]|nr:pentatricopeptide repeat-containing protein At4g38010-like [Carya illinoinensis]XP_042961190.1 pentatricopeptide repeat-containing protein At4g38010-like [Carya illinoinensis]XP_042961192.1 pentatricopeptide repeat-containing protein At4g38010-like [Carya illinoinensis]XP_042961193.1 pentatricopeptide repeat-containing protein At4g38010-like [Carya illinoinensis]XP_042961194.1 pentatricopeptide repeat-containing protein At4g38010-like [Carya illinoinensis]XP_042961195.1 pentatricopeptide re
MNKIMLSRKCLLDFVHRCNNVRSFMQIHAQLLTSGFICDQLVVNRVAEFFGKFADFGEYGCDLLKQIDWSISSFPFNLMISGYAGSDTPRAAVLVYRRMMRNGFMPDMYTFPVVLKSCAKFLGIGEGRQVHGVVVKMGVLSDLVVQNSLVHFYGGFGDFRVASMVFDDMHVRDVVSWSCLISGYVRAGLFDEAIALFLRMDVKPNIATLVSMLVACGRMRHLSLGKEIHGLIVRCVRVDLVVGNAIMDMYVKCECLCEAKQIFDELPEIDIVSWTTMISGLVQCKRPKESLQRFHKMLALGIEPDRLILTSVLSACASLGALDYGRWIDGYIDFRDIKWDTHIGTTMIDMYAKCGCVEMALWTFNEMPFKNVYTWNALLGGLAMHGHGREALKHFEEMIKSGMRPNEVTFLAILTACCHSGLVDEGRRCFHQMISQQHNLSPRLEHYGCMVDMLCRAQLLDEARELIKTMPMPPDVLIWGALLSGCKASGAVELSQEILDSLLELESQDSGVYVLLSNIHATDQRWPEVSRIRRLMKEKGIKKAPGSSVIEVDGKVHEFFAGEASHPQNEDLHYFLNILSSNLYLEGHFSDPF